MAPKKAPGKTPEKAPEKAPEKNSNGDFAFAGVTPAPRKGRDASIAFKEETIKRLADFIGRGEWAGDGRVYETRQKANTRVTRIKRALIHYGHYKDGKEIRSRVWEDGSGKWLLAITDAEKVSK